MFTGKCYAKLTAWGSPWQNSRCQLITDWAVGLDLLLLNTGAINTSVRYEGETIVDFSLASSAAARLVTEWRVMEEVVTLRDNRYIYIEDLPS